MSERTVSVTRASGSAETTEYLHRGAYRVTRCDREGRVQSGMTVAPLPTSRESVYVPLEKFVDGGPAITLMYGSPNDPYWLRRFKRARASSAGNVIPPTAPLPPANRALRPAPARVRARSACADRTFSFLFRRAAWAARGFDWYADVDSMPHGSATLEQLRRGPLTWENTINQCGLGDQNNVEMRLLGDRGTSASLKSDGVNTADWGYLAAVGCGEPGAIACVLTWRDEGGAPYEVDARFGSNWRWAHRAIRNRFDVWSIATHEAGHALGLGQSLSGLNGRLTMFAFVRTGSTSKRTLAKGDVLGMRALYPPR